MKKYTLASLLLIIGVLLAGSISSAQFSDVAPAHVNIDAINYVRDNGIVAGYPDGTFGPANLINRAEFVTMMVRTRFDQARIDSCTAARFPDAPASEWYGKFVCVAVAEGIIAGYPDGTFKPANSLNFAEASAILAQSYGLPKSGDVTWYEPFVNGLAGRNAVPATIYAFDKNVTRGEIAEMIYRLDANVDTKLSLTYDAIDKNELEVPELIVGESDHYQVSQHTIVSQDKITIDGMLELMPTPDAEHEAPDAFELIAENGDIEINGTLKIAGAGSGEVAYQKSRDGRSLTAWLRWPVAHAQNSGAVLDGRFSPIFGQRSIRLTARRGHIVINNTATLQTLDGPDGNDVMITDYNNAAEFEAAAGKDGGDIVLNAPQGQVRIIVPHKDVNGIALFELGNGGNGANVTVEFDRFAEGTSFDEKYTLRGGNGGRSGKLIPNTGLYPPVVYYMRMPNGLIEGPIDPKPSLLNPHIGLGESISSDRLLVLGGLAGDGGEVSANIAEEHDFKNLNLIEFVGGKGGDGVRKGGAGGDALYNNINQLAFTATGDEAPTAKAIGGIGGDVVFNHLPVNFAEGGRGGLCFVQGNGGFDGAHETAQEAASQGQAGGGASCFMGNGGNILKDENVPGEFATTPYTFSSYKELLEEFYVESKGGDGGAAAIIPATAIAGPGGKGGNSCKEGDQGIGGEGGKGGDIFVVQAGEGGRGYIGGRGGDMYKVQAGRGGEGGNGTEHPGAGGEAGGYVGAFASVEAGRGGKQFDGNAARADSGEVKAPPELHGESGNTGTICEIEPDEENLSNIPQNDAPASSEGQYCDYTGYCWTTDDWCAVSFKFNDWQGKKDFCKLDEDGEPIRTKFGRPS